MLKRVAQYCCDLAVVGCAVLLAFLVRKDFEVSPAEVTALLPYAATTMLSGGILLLPGRMASRWRLSTLGEYLRICLLSCAIVFVSLAIAFLGNRLQSIPRALPVLQLLLTVSGLVGLRVIARLLFERGGRRSRERSAHRDSDARTVILYGLNPTTALYVKAVEQLAPAQVRVAGIVTDEKGMARRSFGRYPILGMSRDVARIVGELAVHGVFVTHLCVMRPRQEFVQDDIASLTEMARDLGLAVEFFADDLIGSAAKN